MKLLLCCCVVPWTLTCFAVPALAQRDTVGVVTAVNAKAIGQVPRRPIEQLVIGSTVVRKEQLSTFDKAKYSCSLLTNRP